MDLHRATKTKVVTVAYGYSNLNTVLCTYKGYIMHMPWSQYIYNTIIPAHNSSTYSTGMICIQWPENNPIMNRPWWQYGYPLVTYRCIVVCAGVTLSKSTFKSGDAVKCQRTGSSLVQVTIWPIHYLNKWFTVDWTTRAPSRYKDGLYRYGDFHYKKDGLYHGNSYTGKTTSLYWDAPQCTSQRNINRKRQNFTHVTQEK